MKPLDGLEIYDDAEFYDLEFAGRGHEIPFFLKHARQAGGPVLEVACGTGRITLPIARAGIPGDRGRLCLCPDLLGHERDAAPA
jgi:hypothetical protein